MWTRRFVCALVLTLLVVSVVAAAEFDGVISAIDLERKQLRLEGQGDLEGEQLTFRLDDHTQIRFGKQRGALADLQVGQKVRIDSRPRGGRPVARVIHVSGKKPAATRNDPAVTRASGDLVSGVLRRVALTDREIVVIGPGAKGPETETTIAVPEDARVQRGDSTVSFESLKENEAVTVNVTRRDGRLTAQVVQVGPGVATVAAPSAPAKTGAEPPKAFPRLRKLLKIGEKVLDEIDRRRGGDQP